jgi:hypothetical protein
MIKPYETLKKFESISLEQMDNVKLLDRTDTKFTFRIDALERVLEGVSDHYYVLEAANTRITDYESLYFDTKDLDLYIYHHNDRMNRYKVRYRRYINSGLSFFEVKFKNNKNRTIKSRVKRDGIEEEISGSAKDLLESKSWIKADQLKPALWVYYSRITLVSKALDERLTIDLGLTFEGADGRKSFDTLVIAELKQDKFNRNSFFAKEMTNQRIPERSMSKYCFGVTQVFPGVKQNLFKPKLLNLKKILYGDSSGSY